MKKIKVLNLYACLGGNRYKWDEVADIEVTAVELDPELARMYQERFPNDTVIVADAHQYLLDHYKEFDFIWSSPPCPTHSKINISQYTRESWKPHFPDMKLYEEILFLQHYFKGKFLVENVIPFYEPLIPAIKRGRHLYWSNFNLPNFKERDAKIREWQLPQLEKHHNIDLSGYKGKQNKRKIGRNLVDYEAGKTIFETFLGIQNKQNENQISMF
ncbi:AdoMet_MTases domain containing protein [uncultured Caudovirales phage]|uniref:AdoMet_MTases domain containing protein n=1 Tax=uncultured Caudovirales phage TaxID=2100421 RepID=A0A6J5N1G5_9CAUD|nr:AdoMet_MTases domain containing protein [uncultured Caudovirales phage]